MPLSADCAQRTRNAAATKAAILAAARRHFALERYEAVGLRQISAEAGVDPVLVARYFGSREQLFRETLRGDPRLTLEGLAQRDLPNYLSILLDDDKKVPQRSARLSAHPSACFVVDESFRDCSRHDP